MVDIADVCLHRRIADASKRIAWICFYKIGSGAVLKPERCSRPGPNLPFVANQVHTTSWLHRGTEDWTSSALIDKLGDDGVVEDYASIGRIGTALPISKA